MTEAELKAALEAARRQGYEDGYHAGVRDAMDVAVRGLKKHSPSAALLVPVLRRVVKGGT